MHVEDDLSGFRNPYIPSRTGSHAGGLHYAAGAAASPVRIRLPQHLQRLNRRRPQTYFIGTKAFWSMPLRAAAAADNC